MTTKSFFCTGYEDAAKGRPPKKHACEQQREWYRAGRDAYKEVQRKAAAARAKP